MISHDKLNQQVSQHFCPVCSLRIMFVQHRGGHLESSGNVQYCGGYLENHGGRLVPWGNFMIPEGGYHQYRGGCSVSPHFSFSVPWGDIMIHVWRTFSTLTFFMISPTILNISSPSTEHPHGNERTLYRVMVKTLIP